MATPKRQSTNPPPNTTYSHTAEELETIALDIAKEELVRKLEQLSIKQLAALVMGKNVRIRVPRPPSGTFQRARVEGQGSPEERRISALERLGKHSGQ